MASDLEEDKANESEPKKASAQILKQEIMEGRTAMERPVPILFVSGLSAGLDIGFSLLLMAVMKTQATGQLPAPVVELLIANMYAVGFVFVVLGRSELFTEQTTLAVLPVLNRKASVGSLAQDLGCHLRRELAWSGRVRGHQRRHRAGAGRRGTTRVRRNRDQPNLPAGPRYFAKRHSGELAHGPVVLARSRFPRHH